jgi:uncharacterized membrane protein
MMEEYVKLITTFLGSIIEALAALIVAHGIIKAGYRYIRNSFQVKDHSVLRLELGKVLGMALEFLLAADIVRTAVAPTWEDIGKLAAIAALRTLLNLFLERELHRSDQVRIRDIIN